MKTSAMYAVLETKKRVIGMTKKDVEEYARKRPYRWLNRSTMTEHNEECGKCHFLFRNMRQDYPYCPMCGEHLLPCYKTKER